MTKRSFKIFILVSILALGSIYSNAQKIDYEWTVGMDMGVLLFYGDIKQNDFIPVFKDKNEARFGIGLNIKKKFNPFLGLQLKFTQGKLTGTNRSENKYFVSNTFSWTLNADVNINQIIFYDQDKKNLELYLQIGAGLVDFRGILYDLQTNDIINTRGYSTDGKTKEKMTTELVIPIGLGATYGMKHFFNERHPFFDNVDLVAEFTWFFANTDAIDLESSIRSGNDQYSFMCIGFHYNFK